jgi:hypothetical protein
VLTTAPFSLTQGSSVIAVVYATNSYGTSSSLNFGSGANITILIVPSAPGTPVTTNSGTNVIITWTAPTIGAPFANYTIMIGTINGTWTTTSFCDGTNATTMTSL